MRRTAWLLFCAAVLAALATYAWRGWYARYITDDYCTAGYLRHLGFSEAMRFHRDHWSGRFSYFPVKAMLELIGDRTPRVTPAAMLLLVALATAYAVRRLLEPRSKLLVFAAAIVSAYALIDASPSMFNIAGAWFWETGALTYILPLVVFTFWLGLFAWRRSLAVACGASAGLMFFAGGLSETTLASQGAFTALLLAFALWYGARREAWIAAWGLCATLAALAIMASAGGSIARGTVHTSPRPPGETIALTFDYAHRFFGWHVFPSGAALLPLMAVGVALGMQSERVSARAVGVTVATATGAYLATFVPSAWLLPWTMPERALDVSNYFLALTLFAAAIGAGLRLRGKVPELAVTVAIALLAVVPLLSVRGTLRDIAPAREFARHHDAMTRYLETQRGKAAVVKDGQWALTPAIFGLKERFWVNRCASLYYGLRSLRVEP